MLSINCEKKVKNLFLFFVFICCSKILFAQAKTEFDFDKNGIVTDLDSDGVLDSVYINNTTYKIICRLSSQGFKIMQSKPIEMLNEVSGVTKTKNGFEFYNDWMRAGYKNQFRYNAALKKIQLIGISRYEFGNAAHYGSGESSVNLLTKKYVGNWYTTFVDDDSLYKLPTIKTSMQFKMVTLESFGEDIYFGFADKCAALFHRQEARFLKNIGNQR
jgi:hypothetical protein